MIINSCSLKNCNYYGLVRFKITLNTTGYFKYYFRSIQHKLNYKLIQFKNTNN